MHVNKQLSKEAKRIKILESLSVFARTRLYVRELFNSASFQIATAILIVANFAVNAVEAEMSFHLLDDAGDPSELKGALDRVDLAMTVVFTVELALNLYGHLVWDFFCDGWSLFDFFIVVICTHAHHTQKQPHVQIHTHTHTHTVCVCVCMHLRACGYAQHGKGKRGRNAREREAMTRAGLRGCSLPRSP